MANTVDEYFEVGICVACHTCDNHRKRIRRYGRMLWCYGGGARAFLDLHM
eukprot:JP443481.1.p1 GENE.JP443481.1~~JP443481.1.p1  ORF type:complete len:50 (+),score=1.77 JP443481.1:22-171(+)